MSLLISVEPQSAGTFNILFKTFPSTILPNFETTRIFFFKLSYFFKKMGFFIRMYFLNYWSYIKSGMSIFIGNLTQFNFVIGIFLLTCIVFEIFRKNWKKPPSNAPPAPRSPPTGGDFQYVIQDVPLYNYANFQNYTIFFSIFAILTGLQSK